MMSVAKFKTTINKYNRFYLDTMCFIYHFEGSETYGPLTKTLFSHLETNKLKSITSVLSLAEMLSNRKIQTDPLLLFRYKEKLANTPGLSIKGVDFSISELAASLRFKYELMLIDAVHLSTACLNSAQVFISNDNHFKKTKEIEALILDDYI